MASWTQRIRGAYRAIRGETAYRREGALPTVSGFYDREIGREPDLELRDIDNFLGESEAGGISIVGGRKGRTFNIAAQLSVIYACTKLNADAIAALPCGLYELKRQKRESDVVVTTKSLALAHPLHMVLAHKPNDWQSTFDYWEMVVEHILLQGNHYSYIDRDATGNVKRLIPLHPQSMEPHWGHDGVPRYDYFPNYYEMPRPMRFHVGEIYHVRNGMSSVYRHGLKGLSAIALHRETVELGLQAQRHGLRFYRNYATPRGVLEHPGELGEDAANRLRDEWENKYGGENQHSIAIIEEGMKFHALTMNHHDAQYLESRQFNDVECCRLFSTPPHKVGIPALARTYRTETDANRSWHNDGLLPLVTRMTSAGDRDLVMNSGLNPARYKHDFAIVQLARGDPLTQASLHNMYIRNGVLSINEVREELGRGPVPGGDEHKPQTGQAGNTRNGDGPGANPMDPERGRATNDGARM